MEEAEALATNVAIMGSKMLARGTLSSLQKAYGGSYSVRAVRAAGIDRNQAMSLIRIALDNSTIEYTDHHGQISFKLPHKSNMLGRIMKRMERMKGNVEYETAKAKAVKVIEEYTIAGATLEEVFMNVAREAGNFGAV